MLLKDALKKEIEKHITNYSGKEETIHNILPVHGGDVHSTYKISTEDTSYFLKTSKDVPSDLFKTEFIGLRLLRQQKAISVAEPIGYGRSDDSEFLLMEFIEKTAIDSKFWERFAKELSDLHRCTNDFYGLKEDNYIGALPQSNTPTKDWSDFFIAQRLQPLIQQCIDQKLLNHSFIEKSEVLYKQIPDLFPKENASLLHGDLWGGNYLCGSYSQPYLFDPAVYYGHREIDLAMTRLFGGFDRKFYWYYEDFYPLAPNWQKRIALCQLYPLLVHSLLFGGGYVQQVRRIIEEYG